MIIFDIDDTLYDNLKPFRAALEETSVAADLPDDFPMDELLLDFRGHSDVAFAAAERGGMTVEETFFYRIEKALADYGIRISREEAAHFQKCYQDAQNWISLSDTVKGMLDDLTGRGAGIGIISNGLSEHQRAKIGVLGLGHWFHDPYILISEEAGMSKPDPEIFHTAERQMGCSKNEAWYVGDSFADDVTGASRAGWKTVWMNRRRRPLPEGDVRPDRIAESEEELRQMVSALT